MIDIAKIDNDPVEEIGCKFIDSIGQHWQYCGILLGRDFPLVYRWIPIAFWVNVKVDEPPIKLTVSL